MRTLLPPALLTCWLLAPVNSIHPECRFHLEIQEEETKCAELLRSPTEQYKACSGVWDNITCWRPANVGETVTVPCPKVFSNFYSKAGNISKNCTSDGWSETFPDFVDACGYSDPEDESKFLVFEYFEYLVGLGTRFQDEATAHSAGRSGGCKRQNRPQAGAGRTRTALGRPCPPASTGLPGSGTEQSFSCPELMLRPISAHLLPRFTFLVVFPACTGPKSALGVVCAIIIVHCFQN
ncbi:vasoactive intestinal polypeptide receptor 2 isoform X9 [Macaca fascicularis]|uniref:vasoactive intestinal polypeptide receptor 2 isoform X9 n=1 Tax=Macaca fascicularis TaxID=9541 RepID=UPI003D156A79